MGNMITRNLLTFNLSVNVAKPRILSAPVSTNTLAGSMVSLICSGSGTPLPNITWLFNGNPIPGANQSAIQLVNVDSTKTGNYQCLFQNNAGSTISAIAKLFVYSKYQFN